MCKTCFISAVATYFSVYFLLVAITDPQWSIWLNSFIITALVFIAVMTCPLINKEKLKCCGPMKRAKKKK